MYFFRSWTFCHKLRNGLEVLPNDLKIYQNFSDHSEYASDYCQNDQMRSLEHHCRLSDNVLDCSSDDLFDPYPLFCQQALKSSADYDSILFNFPKEVEINEPDIADFSQEFDFFKHLATNEEMNRNKRNLTIRTIHFDLADLERNTNKRTTEEVRI